MAFRQHSTVGLDIGSRVVKAVQLKKSGKSIELEKFGVAEIYPTGERPASPEDRRAAKVDAIKKALADARISAKQAVSAVAGESIIVRYIQLPVMPEEELKNALRYEAEEYIPFQIQDVNFDSSIIGYSGEGESRRVDVLLVCARKDLINEHIELIREAGLVPTIVDVDAFASLNCFEINYQPSREEVIGLINIGGDITSICVYSDGNPRFSRDISIGGSTITAAIQQRLEVSLAEAEKIKIQRGISRLADKPKGAPGSDNVMDTIRSTVEAMTGESLEGDSRDAQADRTIRNTLGNLVGEIRRSIQFYENQSRGPNVSRIVLSGGTASLKGLDAFIQEEIRLPVETIDPLRRIPVSGRDMDAAFLRENKHTLSVGIGLALRKVVD